LCFDLLAGLAAVIAGQLARFAPRAARPHDYDLDVLT
jgi:hypothetical protein